MYFVQLRVLHITPHECNLTWHRSHFPLEQIDFCAIGENCTFAKRTNERDEEENQWNEGRKEGRYLAVAILFNLTSYSRMATKNRKNPLVCRTFLRKSQFLQGKVVLRGEIIESHFKLPKNRQKAENMTLDPDPDRES